MMKKIVLIDDELAFCKLFTALFEAWPWYSVETFTSGKLALDYLLNNPVDAVFVDMLMPEMDGSCIIQTLSEKLNDLPLIVMVTGMISEAEAEESSDLILSKPINFEHLNKVLTQV